MELILRFTRLDRDAPFDAPAPVTVHYAGSDSETFAFRSLLSDADLADLRWYIERYPPWPVGPDYQRAEALQARLPQLGGFGPRTREGAQRPRSTKTRKAPARMGGS